MSAAWGIVIVYIELCVVAGVLAVAVDVGRKLGGSSQ